MSILIVETDLDVIENITSILNEYQPDWQLFIINSGIGCLAQIEKCNRIDLVITGMKLSDMSGFELTEYIRDDSEIPVVILSWDRDVYTLVKAFNSGANDYIVFPLNEVIFTARLKALLRRRNWNFQIGNDESKDDNNQNPVLKPSLDQSLNIIHQLQT